MLIHLKRNERLFINGAVVRLDRRGTIELMNDAHFLLENHIMQPEDASTPLRQLYFVVQTMILDPLNAHLTQVLFQTQAAQITLHCCSKNYLQVIKAAGELVERQNFFEALKVLRKSFNIENEVLGGSALSGNREDKAA